MGYDNWNNLPKDLLIDIVLRLSCLDDHYRFSAVCKSWNSAAAAKDKPWWLPTSTPMLLLAEDVAPGSILDDTQLNQDYDDADDAEFDYVVDGADADDNYDYLNNSVGTSRGLYSLSSRKTYNIELPEAAGKLILGTNKGWLLTLGRDFQINLLHPLLRLQFSLPPMLTFPTQPGYTECYTPEDATEQFIQKIAISLFYHHTTPSPIVMAIYGPSGNDLGFARLGDKVWTDVNHLSQCPFSDIVYHRGKFYVVDCGGDVYVCCIDDGKERRRPIGTKIASIRNNECDKMYLVEPVSGCGLLLVVRYTKIKDFKESNGFSSKYRTTDFAVWRLDLNYDDSFEIPSCTSSSKVNNLGNEAIFVGRASSLSVSSSEIIKPNSIYFTDDNIEQSLFIGGGHDMGIFDMEHRTTEPHFQGKSVHCISPPLWYI